MDKINYYFKIRDEKEVARFIAVMFKDLGYSELDKDNVCKIYGVKRKDVKDISSIIKAVGDAGRVVFDEMADKCEQLKRLWEGYKDAFFKSVKNGLKVEFGEDVLNTYCYLHLLPINELKIKSGKIYLDASQSVDELFKNFIILATKLLVLERWNCNDQWKRCYEYEAENKVWLFAEIAVDAIFFNTELRSLCDAPSYKYFYGLKIEDVNIMEQFRELFKLVSIEDFFAEIYMFVHKNYETIIKFKNYLY